MILRKEYQPPLPQITVMPSPPTAPLAATIPAPPDVAVPTPSETPQLSKVSTDPPSTKLPTAQLSSFCTLGRAQKMAEQLKLQASDALAGQIPFIRVVTAPDNVNCPNGKYHRVVVGPFANRAQALQYCGAYNSKRSQGPVLQCVLEILPVPNVATNNVPLNIDQTFFDRLFGG
jgi:cell division septation protein DedD